VQQALEEVDRDIELADVDRVIMETTIKAVKGSESVSEGIVDLLQSADVIQAIHEEAPHYQLFH